MSEQLKFYTVEELQNLSLEELQALWELVPTSRQRAYRQAYEREVRNAGALGSDQLEQQVTAELLSRYEESALVPVGMRWARTPSRVQDAAKSDDGLVVHGHVRVVEHAAVVHRLVDHGALRCCLRQRRGLLGAGRADNLLLKLLIRLLKRRDAG